MKKNFHLKCLPVLLLFIACQKNLLPEKSTTTFSQDALNTNAAAVAAAAQNHDYMVLFNGGNDGYHSYRIPSIVRSNAGTLIAFAEGRMSNNYDYGNINVVYKRSTDNGVSWSALGQVVGNGLGTWGNPTAVVDRSNGRIWIFLSWNDADHNQSGTDGYQKIDSWGERKVYSSYSDDDSITWSTPVDRTTALLPSNYTWDAMGPGVGIQVGSRLIIPATGRNIYSDDHGVSWQYALIPSGTSEGTIVDLVNGQLLRNDRPITAEWDVAKRRQVARGTIENGFSAFAPDNTLLDPKCEGSIVRYTGSPDRIMFLNPASTERRCKMRVRISYDGGLTWPISRKIHDWLTDDQTCDQGKGGYSSMVKTADYHIGALIEINEDVSNNTTSHRSIEFHKFNLPWMLNGSTEPL